MKIDTYWHLIDQISAAVIVMNDDGIVEQANQGSLDLMGIKAMEQVVGVEFEQFLSPENLLVFKETFLFQLPEKKHSEIKCNLIHQDGSSLPVSLTGASKQNQSDANPQIVLTLRELTDTQHFIDGIDQRKKLEDMQWLADQGRILLSISHWPDILDMAGQALQEKLGDCVVITLTKVDELHLQLEGIYGISGRPFSQAWKLIGGELYGRVMPIDPRYVETYSKRKLYLYSDGLEEIAISQIPKNIGHRITNLIGIENIYTIGLEGNQEVMGCFYIFTLDPDLILNSDLVESFTFQVALALEKTKYAEELRLSEEQFQTIFEYAPDGYYLCDLHGTFINGNISAEKITGYDREELIGANFMNAGMISKDQTLKAGKLLAQNLIGKSTGPDEFVITRKDNSQVPVEITTHPVKLGEKDVVLGIARDISDRKQVEDTLEKASDTLTRVLEGIDAHVYVADMDSHEILYMNKKMIEDFGGDFIGKPCFEIFRGEEKSCSHCTNEDLVNDRGKPGEVVIWESQNQKTGNWYRNYDRAIYWIDQRLVRMQIAVDITDTILASRDIELSEKRYRNLFEASKNALMTLAPPDWTFLSGNPAVIEMFNVKDEDHFRRYLPWQLSPEYQPDGQKSDEKAQMMIHTAVENGSHFFNWTHKKITGEEFPATVQLTKVDLEDDFFIQATVKDITDQVNAEEKLEQQMLDLALLNDLNEAANQGKDLNEITAQVSRDTERIFLSRGTTVYLLSEDESCLHVNLKNLNSTLLTQMEKLLGITMPEYLEIPLNEDSYYRKLLDSGETRILSTKGEIFELVYEYMASTFLSERIKRGLKKLMPKIYQLMGIQSVLIAPLISAGKPFGFIDMSSTRVFSEDEKNRFNSIADQLSGIIQKINAENDRVDKLTELELINRAFVEGSRIDNIDDICQLLAESVYEINPGTLVIVTLYDPDMDAIRVRSLAGLGNKAGRLFKLLGKKPEEFLVNPAQIDNDEDLNALFTSGKMELVPDGLYALTRGIVPRTICKSAEKMMGVDQAYIIGFGLGKMSVGGLVLFVKEGEKVHHSTALETIVNHFAVVFERRETQKEILERKAQLEALRDIELEIASQLNLEDLLYSIAVKARSIVKAKASGFSIYHQEKNILEYIAYTGFDELPENTTIKPGEGLSGKVWEKKETIIVEDYSKWDGKIDEWAEVGDYYLGGFPVCWGEENLGVLEIALNVDERLSQSDISTLELFATQAAIAIKNAQLFREEKLRRQEAETLSEVGMLINRMMGRDELLDMILASLQKVVPYDSASIQLVNGSDIVVEAFHGTEYPEKVIGKTFKIQENVLAHPILYNGKNVILDNRHDIENWLEGPETLNVKSWLAVPLEIKGSRIGILTLDHYSAGQYTEHDANLAKDFANQAVIALENNRLFEEIRRRTREIEVVYESALTLVQELQPEVLFNHLYEQVESLFAPDAFILATYENAQDMIQVSYATEVGVRQTQVEGIQISPNEKNSLLSWIIRNKTPLLIGNVETDSLPIKPQQQGKTIRSWLGVPLLVADRLVGALVVQSYQAHAYTHDHRRLLQLLGNQVAIALENSRLFDDAQRRLSRLSSLREVDQTILGSVNLEMTMEVLIGQLIQTLEVDAACVLAFDPGQQVLEYINCHGFKNKPGQQTPLKLGVGLAGKAAQDRSLVHIPDLGTTPTELDLPPYVKSEKFVSYIAHPLIAKGELVGVLEVFHRNQLEPNSEWINFLDALARLAAIAIDRLNLYNNLERSNIELSQAYDATIEGWARAIELRDGETEGHSRRVVSIMMNLARIMGISGEQLTHMRRGALLHDIGKMAIPDGILLNPGKLTEEEWTLMKKHPLYAIEMLSTIDYLEPALEIPLCHHERWDGTGYPRGLSGEDIPLAARIFAIVDVWDALQSDRPYRDAWKEEQAIQYLKEQSGLHFDPDVVEAFFKLINKS